MDDIQLAGKMATILVNLHNDLPCIVNARQIYAV
jgi:hypothetical protein